MAKHPLVEWQQKTLADLNNWSTKAKSQLRDIFESLCQQEEISDKDFVLALNICRAMVRSSKYGFVEHACFDKGRYEQWLEGQNLPLMQARKLTLELVWVTADRRDLSDVEKMIHIFKYDFDIPPTVTSPSEPIWVKSTTSSERPLIFDPWIHVKDLDLSSRSINCILDNGAQYLGQIVSLTEIDLLAKPNFGRKSIEEVKFILSTKGAYLGMTHPAIEAFLADLNSGKTKPESN